MEMDKQEQQKVHQPEADLLVPTLNHDPEGKPVYHPAIGKGTIWGGLTGGVLTGFLAWLIASGVWPIAGLGQIASGSAGSAVFLGFIVGSAAGGLIGSLNGLRHMLLTHEYYSSES